jgi:hypothetical protein
MASDKLVEIMRQAEQLSPDDQLRLIERLAMSIRLTSGKPQRERSWLEAEGITPYPLLGEDAQAWITRTRREGDERRERLLRGEQ